MDAVLDMLRWFVVLGVLAVVGVVVGRGYRRQRAHPLIHLPTPSLPISEYRSIDDLLGLIDEPAASACRRILEDNRRLFETVQGSSHNHQNWPGGYADHVAEVMNLAVILHARFDSVRPLPFSLSDALLIVYLHDVEKPWKYEPDPNGGLRKVASLHDKHAQRAFRERKLREYGVVLTADQHNALTYVEGEYKDYSNKHRVMGPLAAFCHLCDVTSARIWFDCPKEENDPWPGACRIRQAR